MNERQKRALEVLEYYQLVGKEFPAINTNEYNAFIEQHKIHRGIARTMVCYDRLYEAELVASNLHDFSLKVLDFGCGVGDYGIFLAKKGASVTFYDQSPIFIDFVKFRCKKENLNCSFFLTDEKTQTEVIQNQQLVIFGEVLEHLPNPFVTLKICCEQKIPYVWTSAYPCVKNPNYFKIEEHVQSQRLQDKCRMLMEEHYNFTQFGTKSRFWCIKTCS